MNFKIKVGCTSIKLSKPPAGRTGPMLTAVLKEIGEGTKGNVTFVDVPDHIVEQLRAGLMNQNQYEMTIDFKAVRKAQGDLFPAVEEKDDDE